MKIAPVLNSPAIPAEAGIYPYHNTVPGEKWIPRPRGDY